MRIDYRNVKVKGPDCKITPGLIFGCIWGCKCCRSHDFEVKLYKVCDEEKILMYCEKVRCCGCFEIEADYDGCYLLCVTPDTRKDSCCKPVLALKNVGVSSLMVDV